jgi:hypothetical protein
MLKGNAVFTHTDRAPVFLPYIIVVGTIFVRLLARSQKPGIVELSPCNLSELRLHMFCPSVSLCP